MGDFVAYPSRSRLALLSLGAVAFVAIGLWLGGALGSPPVWRRSSPTVMFAVGWFSVVFFGFCGIVSIRRLFDTGDQLRIGPMGIRSTPWSDQTIPWSEIADVTARSFGGQKAIILHLRDARRFPGRSSLAIASANRFLTDGDVAISLTGTDRSFDEAMSAIARFRH